MAAVDTSDQALDTITDFQDGFRTYLPLYNRYTGSTLELETDIQRPFDQLREIDFARLTDVAECTSGLADDVDQQLEDVNAQVATVNGWTGNAGNAFRGYIQQFTTSAQTIENDLDAISTATTDAVSDGREVVTEYVETIGEIDFSDFDSPDDISFMIDVEQMLKSAGDVINAIFDWLGDIIGVSLPMPGGGGGLFGAVTGWVLDRVGDIADFILDALGMSIDGFLDWIAGKVREYLDSSFRAPFESNLQLLNDAVEAGQSGIDDAFQPMITAANAVATDPFGQLPTPPEDNPIQPQQPPGTGPGAGPGSGPGSGPGAGPGSGPGSSPGAGPGSGPGAGPGSGPGSGPGAGPGSGPGVDPGSGPGSGPGVDTGSGPGSGPGAGPGVTPPATVGPGAGPGNSSGADPVGPGPGTEPGSGPGTGPGAGPGVTPPATVGPGAGPGSGPGAGPGAGPGSGPGVGPGAGVGVPPVDLLTPEPPGFGDGGGRPNDLPSGAGWIADPSQLPEGWTIDPETGELLPPGAPGGEGDPEVHSPEGQDVLDGDGSGVGDDGEPSSITIKEGDVTITVSADGGPDDGLRITMADAQGHATHYELRIGENGLPEVMPVTADQAQAQAVTSATEPAPAQPAQPVVTAAGVVPEQPLTAATGGSGIGPPSTGGGGGTALPVDPGAEPSVVSTGGGPAVPTGAPGEAAAATVAAAVGFGGVAEGTIQGGGGPSYVGAPDGGRAVSGGISTGPGSAQLAATGGGDSGRVVSGPVSGTVSGGQGHVLDAAQLAATPGGDSGQVASGGVGGDGPGAAQLASTSDSGAAGPAQLASVGDGPGPGQGSAGSAPMMPMAGAPSGGGEDERRGGSWQVPAGDDANTDAFDSDEVSGRIRGVLGEDR